METIKTQVTNNIRRVITKVIDKERRVSCSCCCLCQIFTNAQMLLNWSKTVHNTRMKINAIIGEQSKFSVGGKEYVSTTLADTDNYNFKTVVGRPTTGSPEWLRRKPACLRWVCRCVSVDELGGVTVLQQKIYGGPTLNNRDLWEDIALPVFGEESSSGTYLYIINFLGLFRRRRRGYPPFTKPDYPSTMYWESRDDLAYMIKERINIVK